MMQYPLSSHLPEDVIAHRPGELITASQFYQQAVALARELPETSYIINTCQDRYLFMLGFAAAALSGKITLMPSSFAPNTISQLQSRYPGLLCVHDGRDQAQGLPDFLITGRALANIADLGVAEVPQIDAEQVVSIVFTSGSTGEPTAHSKRWGLLCRNGASESERLQAKGTTIVATVPPQHMYGFESSVLLALHGGSSIWNGKPFYPADIIDALHAAPSPRMLVTTPFHLSTLMAANLPLPSCDMVLSATAPLPLPLAERAEQEFKAPLLEIYGCTESGQVASRRPSHNPAWELLPGVKMDARQDGAWVFDGHVEGRVQLSDHIEDQGDGHFILLGRHEDMVNVVGKRTSIPYLNSQLQAIPGVVDGCFLQPDPSTEDAKDLETVQRLVALVVAPTLETREILAQLRSRIDAVFLPRPVLRVDALPRNATGKLVRSELLALYDKHRS
ncbi:AMP-binding protein [Ottowia thiooxydans]|uniref:Acyl-coenzyme A synthetase/AMP-(Fatty) acid ligase n=1 Tax=Ottowia thiooxydans TaxID=219182 RepID=A0ABV2Q1P0_9BURK